MESRQTLKRRATSKVLIALVATTLVGMAAADSPISTDLVPV